MRNRNDEGNVHFDQSTDENYVTHIVGFKTRGVYVRIHLSIPHTIYRALNSSDFDAAIDHCKEHFDKTAVRLICEGKKNIEEVMTLARCAATVDICECLYNRFIEFQNRAGNEAWAVPSTMQRIGPRPEEDSKYLRRIN